ncbi:MAG TPA: IS1634 family transposase [Chloroflexota bacterium]|nr:IS1634 family transposase [Chloroflexota bacterium]
MARRARPIRAWALADAPPAPEGQAAVLEAALDRALVRSLGALAALLPLCEQLGLREIVNRRCYPDGDAPEDLDVGVVTLVLVLNRLQAPPPLVHVEEWMGQSVLPDLLGIAAEQCNDDRLARTLDTVLPHLDALWQDLVVAAITRFGVDLSALCYDITSISFCGAYDDADLVRYGYSRDHRPDRKQIELAATVTAAGGIPVDYRPLAGNVADRTPPVEQLRRLQGLLTLLPRREAGAPSLVISDRAMLTDAALAAYAGSRLRYLGPLDPSVGHGAVRALLATVSAAEVAAHPLPYRPRRAEKDPDWEAYCGVERPLTVPHPDPTQDPLTVRALVVWSPGKARLDANLRQTHLRRLERSLADLAKKGGKRPYTTVEAVRKRVAALCARHPARHLVTTTVSGGPGTDAPLRLAWQHDEAALAQAAALDGRYVLGTNDPDLDAAAMLAHAKWRAVPEKRFALVKGPLAVRPVYVHKEGRILGLVFCTMVALLLFSLLELLLRRAEVALTGQQFIAACAPVALVILQLHDGTALRQVTGLPPPLATLLQAHGWPAVPAALHPLSGR